MYGGLPCLQAVHIANFGTTDIPAFRPCQWGASNWMLGLYALQAAKWWMVNAERQFKTTDQSTKNFVIKPTHTAQLILRSLPVSSWQRHLTPGEASKMKSAFPFCTCTHASAPNWCDFPLFSSRIQIRVLFTIEPNNRSPVSLCSYWIAITSSSQPPRGANEIFIAAPRPPGIFQLAHRQPHPLTWSTFRAMGLWLTGFSNPSEA